MRDLTVLAIPGYLASMGAEYAWLRRRADTEGPSPVDYERKDTVASLTMGVGSLIAPLVVPRLLAPLIPGRGRYGKALVGVAAGAAVVTTLADHWQRSGRGGPRAAAGEAPWAVRVSRVARQVSRVGGVVTVGAGAIALTTTISARFSPNRLWRWRLVRDLGRGPLALATAVAGWDFLYYWNHRFLHQTRLGWAVHVVHHSSQRYNLSTALRQPVADALELRVPYSLLCLVGVRPALIERARELNLLYQFWIHTDAIGRLGAAEGPLNTPSHHRVHHASNGRYLDRNHGSILIIWDRLFGTFEDEDEAIIYGLTKNIGTFNPWRIATHEYAELVADLAASRSWRERLAFVLRSPGWAAQARKQRAAPREPGASAVGPAPAGLAAKPFA